MTIPIRWRDLDLLGHLNQAVYHELLEDARGGLLAKIAPDLHHAWVLARVELDYRTEVRKDHGEVEVTAAVEEVGTKSVKLRQELRHPDGTVAATGRFVIVAWDSEARTSRTISDREREAFLDG